jgi:endonuclease III
VPTSKTVSTRRVRAVFRRLAAEQGPFTPGPPLPVLDQIVATILSQHTSDINSARAFAALKERYLSWEEVLDAPVQELAAAIRSGGLAEQKAPRIKAVLELIEDREGSLDLKRLNDMDDQEVADYLIGLPGVGPKTAACVLVFSMGRDAFPVDTHVHRIVRRLGWVESKASAEDAHRELTPVILPEIRYGLHVALVSHGRRICRAQRPRCTECVVFDFCAAGPRFIADGEAV